MANMKIGYARVSSPEQKLEIQLESLKEYGADKIYAEKISGSTIENREQLKRCLDDLRPGDTLLVTKIDRLARSMFDLSKIVNELISRGVNIEFIYDKLRFKPGENNMMDMLTLNILSSFAQFERDIIQERAKIGRERAKAKGTHMGRPAQDHSRVVKAVKLFANREKNNMSVSEIVKITGVPRATIYYKAKQFEKN